MWSLSIFTPFYNCKRVNKNENLVVGLTHPTRPKRFTIVSYNNGKHLYCEDKELNRVESETYSLEQCHLLRGDLSLKISKELVSISVGSIEVTYLGEGSNGAHNHGSLHFFKLNFLL